MVDNLTREERSKMMAKIRSRDTKPEVLVRKHLHSLGYRFSLNRRICQVRPDIILTRHKTCIFVHGCFWHRHEGCSLSSTPGSNVEFWKNKFRSNVERDRRNIDMLFDACWSVGIIWECAVRKNRHLCFDFLEVIGKRKEWVLG